VSTELTGGTGSAGRSSHWTETGYTFNVVNCTKVTVNNQDMYTSYQATAVPQSIGKSGHRGFCIDEAGEIKSDLSGGTNRSQAIQ
jgi:type IV pilus assembly protein PilA